LDLDWAGRGVPAPFLASVPGLRLAAVLQRTGERRGKDYPGRKSSGLWKSCWRFREFADCDFDAE